MTNDDGGLVVATVGGAVAKHLDQSADRRHTWIVSSQTHFQDSSSFDTPYGYANREGR
jgi:hypothetical protein